MANEAEAEIARMKELEDRIKAPSIWGRLACGLRFEDLRDVRYEEAIRFLKKHFLPDEITWRSMKIAEDKEGMDEFIHNARIWLKDRMSIAVIKEGKEKLVGLLVMRIQTKDAFSRTFSKVKLTYNEKYTTVNQFYNALEAKVDIFKEMNTKRYLKIYVLALKFRYRHRGVGKELIKAAKGLAESAFVPVMTGIFQTTRLQKIAEEIGFVKFAEIYYIRYLIDGEIAFWDTGEGNYGAAIMGWRMPGVIEKDVGKITSPSQANLEEAGDEEDGKDEGEKKKE